MIAAELLNILICPACKSKVILEENQVVCGNASCGLRFPIRDEIPVMLIDETKKP